MSLLRGAKLVPETTDPISDKASGRQRSELGEDFRTEGNQPGPFCRQVLRACPARCNQNPHFPPPPPSGALAVCWALAVGLLVPCLLL